MSRLPIPTCLLVSALLGLAAAPAGAQAPGEVGGPPSEELFEGLPPKPYPGLGKKLARPRSKPIVIGVGSTVHGRLEVIAQASNKGTCIFIDYLEDDYIQGGPLSGHCRTTSPSAGAAAYTWEFTYTTRLRNPLMSVTGSARSDAAAVTVTSENDGKRKIAAAVVAKPDQSILARLHRTEPLVVFHSVFRGCVPPQKTVATAFDATGTELGRHRGLRAARKHFHPACRAERANEQVTLGYTLDWFWGFAYEFF